MSTQAHNFKASLAVADRWNPVIDAWLSRYYAVREPPEQEVWTGVTRWLTRPDGTEVSVLYKCDQQTQRTGNFFVELISNDRGARNLPPGVARPPKDGWAVASSAEWVLYCAVPDLCYPMRLTDVHDQLATGWKYRTRVRSDNDEGYASEGVLVPTWTAENLWHYAYRLDGPCMEHL